MMPLLAAARAIHFVSLMAVFGGSSYSVLLQRAKLAGPPAKPRHILFNTAATLALFTGILWFCLVAGQMSGSWLGSVDPSTLELAASGTRFGQIFLVRLVGLVLLWILAVSANRIAVPIVAALLLALLGPVSHAAATGGDVALIGAANDAVHLMTAGFWLGGLMILALLLFEYWRKPAELLEPLRLFSTWGSFVVALLVVTGLLNAVSILPASAWSLHNAYFRLLAIKVACALGMIALAALNRWRFAPILRSEGKTAKRLAGSIGVEIVLGVTVVAIASYLGLMAPRMA